MSDSILISTKKILGLEADYTDFDLDVMTHINSVFNTLTQLGVGPSEGYMIESDADEWADFLSDNKSLNSVKTYVYLKVRLLFDPPTTSYLIDALKQQAQELEWRLNVTVDTNPIPDYEDNDLVWEIADNEGFPEDAEEGDVGFDPETGNVWRKL